MIPRAIRVISSVYKVKHFEKYLCSIDIRSRRFFTNVPLTSDKILPSTNVDDSDVFGTLEKPKNEHEFFEGDEGDRREEERLSKENPRQIRINIEYTRQIKGLLKQRKLSEALSILDSGNLTKPDAYVYGLLIRSCGQVGYTKKAFKLYNQMKKRGIKPRASVYTSLFNACSQSPWKEDGLSRASHLLESLESSGYEPNNINYNAMIKAFGRCGDLSSSFRLVDQMIDRGIMPESSTFAFLLQACVSDQEAGFRHAVLVWDKMLSKGIQPSIYTYNLMLRCCKDCNSGEGIDIKKLSTWRSRFQLSGKDDPRPVSLRNDILTLPPKNIEASSNCTATSDSDDEILSNVNKFEKLERITPQEALSERRPIDVREKMVTEMGKIGGSQIIVSPTNALVKPVSPQDRLQCLGGCSGILEQMAAQGLKPDIKTFTQLLEIIPPNESAEKSLMLALKQNDLPEDVEFYNMLIKKRTMRFDYDGARTVLQLMSAAGIHPNVMTFGILALGCKNRDESAEFVAKVKDSGFRLNAEMVGGLLSGACYRYDVFHVLDLMELCIKDKVRPNDRLVRHLKELRRKMDKAVQDSENGLPTKKQFSLRAYNTYKMRLTSWLKEIDLSEADQQHPWEQFRRHHKSDKKEMSEIG